MRILLVGNYALDRQSSMLRYAEMLRVQMTARGHAVEIVQPRTVFGATGTGAVRKWLGYVDKYLIFPWTLRKRTKRFDVVHVCDHSNAVYLPYAGSSASVTCHDLLAIASARGHYPSQRVSRTGKVLQRWILGHLAAAKNVVCVSSNTARELEGLSATRMGGRKRNVAIIPNALNYRYAPSSESETAAMRTRLGLAQGEAYLLHIGGDHWYKNRPGVLRIFKALDGLLEGMGRTRPRLVMAGHALPRELRAYVAEEKLAGRVIEVVDPSNEDLQALYTGAAALLFPSLYEGFGWPLIEAQSCGCPVITSNRAPMTEVAGEAAMYVDPDEEEVAAAMIASRLDGLSLLREAGFRNVERFAPEAIVLAYEEFFRLVAAGSQVKFVSETVAETGSVIGP